jgi:hypothetical protein
VTEYRPLPDVLSPTMSEEEPTGRRLLRVRATIQLPGLGLGQFALVDPDDPYMRELLEGGFLVAEGPVADGR